uniref:RUN domain-containing protein n=1 Tax=Macrostomum lignano TaxID=282301 RepID=A0A1I8FL11_9PLAT
LPTSSRFSVIRWGVVLKPIAPPIHKKAATDTRFDQLLRMQHESRPTRKNDEDEDEDKQSEDVLTIPTPRKGVGWWVQHLLLQSRGNAALCSALCLSTESKISARQFYDDAFRERQLLRILAEQLFKSMTAELLRELRGPHSAMEWLNVQAAYSGGRNMKKSAAAGAVTLRAAAADEETKTAAARFSLHWARHCLAHSSRDKALYAAGPFIGGLVLRTTSSWSVSVVGSRICLLAFFGNQQCSTCRHFRPATFLLKDGEPSQFMNITMFRNA